jgi:hypothetical protein
MVKKPKRLPVANEAKQKRKQVERTVAAGRVLDQGAREGRLSSPARRTGLQVIVVAAVVTEREQLRDPRGTLCAAALLRERGEGFREVASGAIQNYRRVTFVACVDERGYIRSPRRKLNWSWPGQGTCSVITSSVSACLFIRRHMKCGNPTTAEERVVAMAGT